MLSDCLAAELEERRGFLWLAVCFGIGPLVYFALPREPEPLAIGIVLAGLFLLFVAGRERVGIRRSALCALAVAAGVGTAQFRVASLSGPQIESPFATEVEGRVIRREERVERRPRIVLDKVRIGIGDREVPRRIRLSLSEGAELPPVGARIGLKARLMPVPGPAVPGGYDPRRAAFFEGIGGGGFSLGGWQTIEPPPPRTLALLTERVRQAAVARIRALEPGTSGAVAAALLVGERSGLPEAVNESLRLSGLAHILSISGLHMMLIAGAAFFSLRAIFATSTRLALSMPIRKWSAIGAILVATIYLGLSGGSVATVRAYVMAVIVFAAILVDRPPISMRNLALAAFVVLALEPESVAEPGFQMSFAAVAGLVAAWEAWSGRTRLELGEATLFPGQRIVIWVAAAIFGVMLTTLVASFATAPYGAYHFERVATYSLLGNLVAMPLVSAIIMPAALATLVAMPLGLEAWPLWTMARGIDMLIAASDAIAALPGADTTPPPLPAASLLIMTAGLLWLCLWRRRWRLFGIAAIAGGLASAPILYAAPDLLVSADGVVTAVRGDDGRLRASGSKSGSYVLDQVFEKEREAADGEIRDGVMCDDLGCILPGRGGVTVAHVRDQAALLEDCERAAIIVATVHVEKKCSASLIIDAQALRTFGSHAARFEGVEGALRARVITERGEHPRPWQARGLPPAKTRQVAPPVGVPISSAGVAR
jgi:competence protein ComEC